MKLKANILSIIKKLLLISIFLVGVINFTSAQDIITLRTGEEIKAKVNAVELNVIKYTKFDNQTGPIYSVYKADVFMIKYENGSKDVFDYKEVIPADLPPQNDPGIQVDGSGKLSCVRGNVMKDKQKLRPYEVKSTMNQNYEALRRYKGGRAFKTVGIIFTVIGCIDITTGISNTFQSYDATSNFLVGGIEIGIGLIFSSVSKNKINSSVVLYNLGLKNQHSPSLSLGLNQNGLGMCLNF